MKLKIKRLLSVVLSLVMIVAMLPMTANAAENKTVYFYNTEDWSTVNAYYWGGTSKCEWPGTAMTQVNDKVWSIDISADTPNIIFNNGSKQTADLKVPSDEKPMYILGDKWTTYTEGDIEVEVKNITINFNNTGNWSEVYAYTWGGLSANTWPGTLMTDNGDGTWSIEFSGDTQNIIFNNNAGTQTPNLVVPADGATYVNGTGWVTEGSGDGDQEETPTETLYYVVGSMNGWTEGTDYVMTDNSDGTYTWSGELEASDTKYELKVKSSTNSWYPSDNVVFMVNTTSTVTVTYNSADGTVVATGDGVGEYVPEMVTLYYDNTFSAWDIVYAHYWGGTGATEWPGIEMTNVIDNIWSVEVPEDNTGIIFNNNAGSQTDDLAIPTDGTNMWDGSVWTTYEYIPEDLEVTLDASGVTGADGIPNRGVYLEPGQSAWVTASSAYGTVGIYARAGHFNIIYGRLSIFPAGNEEDGYSHTLELMGNEVFSLYNNGEEGLFIFLSFEAEKAPAVGEAIQCQDRVNANGGRDVRLIAYVDDLAAYSSVSFTLTVGEAVSNPMVCTTAYTGIYADGVLYSTEDIYGADGYFVTYVITDYDQLLGTEVTITATYTSVTGETATDTRTVTIK